MTLSTLTKLAAALSTLMILGVLAAPAAVALSHTPNDANTASMNEMEQEMQAMQDRLHSMFDDEDEQATEPSTSNHNYGSHYKKMKKQPEETGSIRVCKVLVNEDGDVIRGTSIPGVEFSTDLSNTDVDETFTVETPLNRNTDLVDEHEGVDAECTTYDDLELGETYEYTPESVTGDNTDRVEIVGYNDRFRVGTDDLNDVFEPNENNRADGEIVLTTNTPDRTLLMLNTRVTEEDEEPDEPEPNKTKKGKKMYYHKYMDKKQPVRRGSISVCKVLIDENNTVLTGEGSDVTFSTDLSRGNAETTAAFESPLNLTTDLNDDDADDAECVRYRNLRLGTYQYTEENISGDDAENYVVLGYNDDWELGESNESEFFEYGEDSLSDGEITLTAADRHERLVILNQEVTEEDEEPDEPEPNKTKKGKKMYYHKYMDKMPMTTDDEGEQADEEELAEEDEESSDASLDQSANSNIEQDCEVNAFGSDTNADCTQEANNNIEQDADVNAENGGTASATQTGNSNLQQSGTVTAE